MNLKFAAGCELVCAPDTNLGPEALTQHKEVTPLQLTCSDKQTLREALKVARASLSYEERSQAEKAVMDKLRSSWFEYACAHNKRPQELWIAGFWPFGSEIDLWPFYFEVLDQGAHIAFPAMVASGQMEFFELTLNDLTKDLPLFLTKPTRIFALDSEEMAGHTKLDLKALDIIICPLLGFDQQKRRLGYGGGNYDRYLPHTRPDALKLGVAFAIQECPALPTEPHDYPLDEIFWA